MDRVRIGNGCGFWGDDIDAPVRLAESGELDYLTLEYLAELTMSILARQRQRDPQAGYATDFPSVLERLAPTLKGQAGLKIVTNAGGMNPHACAREARAVLDRNGLSDRKVGVVSGDDLMSLVAGGLGLPHFDTGEPFDAVRHRAVSANAYFGAGPIVGALRAGASVVITGRVADASLALGPAVHEFGWAWDDLDRLCAGTVAGHLIECGAQVTGGIWSDWSPAVDLTDVGYPIAVVERDGTVTITKPAGTGGLVTRTTVAEQLLYEVGDPSAYRTPDVTADFTSLRLDEAGPDAVRLTGARGRPAPDSYKVSAAYRDGFTAAGTLVVVGPGAVAKARHCGEIILGRLKRAGVRFDESRVECLGAGECQPCVTPGRAEPHEVVLRVAVRDADRGRVERFTREFAPLVTSGPPGVTGYATGRPAVREVFAFWPSAVPKSLLSPGVTIL